MATPKTWTAADVQMKVIRLHLDKSNVLHVMQGYVFVDSNGDEIPELPDRTVQVSVDFTSLPQAIQDALAEINNYTYTQALTQEGMT